VACVRRLAIPLLLLVALGSAACSSSSTSSPSPTAGLPSESPPEASLSTVVPAATVPDLYGLTLKHATSFLATATLALGDVSYKTGPAMVGTVYKQDPAPGQKVQQGATVDIWIAQGTSPTP